MRINVVKEQGGYRLAIGRSEEHTSELQSRRDLVCRLLREKKITLDLKNVRQFSVERIRPEVPIILGFDLLNVDTNLVARTLHASLQDVRHPELFCDGRDVV